MRITYTCKLQLWPFLTKTFHFSLLSLSFRFFFYIQKSFVFKCKVSWSLKIQEALVVTIDSNFHLFYWKAQMAHTLEFLLLWEPRGLGGQVQKRWALVPALLLLPRFHSCTCRICMTDMEWTWRARLFSTQHILGRCSEGEEVNRLISPISTSPFL